MIFGQQVAGLQTGIKKTTVEYANVAKEIKLQKEVNKEKTFQLQSLVTQIEKAGQKLELNTELLRVTQCSASDLEAAIQVIFFK